MPRRPLPSEDGEGGTGAALHAGDWGPPQDFMAAAQPSGRAPSSLRLEAQGRAAPPHCRSISAPPVFREM